MRWVVCPSPFPTTCDVNPSLTLRESLFVLHSLPRLWVLGSSIRQVPAPPQKYLCSNGEMTCTHRLQAGTNSIRLRTREKVKTVEQKGSWSGQGCFLEEEALQVGLVSSSNSRLLHLHGTYSL